MASETTKLRTHSIETLLPQMVEAGLSGNRQRLELLTLTAIRSFRRGQPGLAADLGSLLAKFSANSAALRWSEAPPPPSDSEEGLSLLRFQALDDIHEPFLAAAPDQTIKRFLQERVEQESLLAEGFSPPRSLLLKGPPGTGKTMLAMWIAERLGLPMVFLDLATSISSFLGKTGSNLRRSLDYAKSTPCVILLDEFDAIAKRRDDSTEVGELKRIVNVLLKELEEWPLHSVLIAATNHPELLDPAIHRRFDVTLDMQLPEIGERSAIMERACGRFSQELPSAFISSVAQTLEGKSGSDIVSITQGAIRRHLVEKIPLAVGLVDAILQSHSESSAAAVAQMVAVLHDSTNLTIRQMSEILGRSPSTVQYYLNKQSPTKPTLRKPKKER